MSSCPSPEVEEADRRAEGVKGGRNRPRARLVCTTCRQRKVKCDAEKLPSGAKCSPCRAANTQCIVNRNGDRRRYGASRRHMATLDERIQSLESMLKQKACADQSITLPSPQTARLVLDEHSTIEMQPPIPSASSIAVLGPHSPNTDRGGNTVSINSSDGQTGYQTLPTNWDLLPANSTPTFCSADAAKASQVQCNELSFHTAEQGLQNSSAPEVPGLANNTEPTPAPDDFLPQLNVDDSRGDLRFYGPTTQLHVHSPSDESIPGSADDDDMECDISMNLDSLQLRKVLLSTFFKVQPRSQIIVGEELFMAAWVQGHRCQYYSKFLEDALLASATRHSTSSAVRKLGKPYAERAKTQIASELEQPNISSLQGFLLLSDFEATRGRARIGWTYSVIACGLLVDLGLHVECSDLVKNDKLTPIEADFRTVLLLGTFVYATLWSLYLGRPNCISLPVLRAVHRATAKSSNIDSLHVWVGLCMQMLDIINILNGPSSLAALNGNSLQRLWELESGLRSFSNTLPPDLAYKSSQRMELDANAYGLQMQFCGIQITLHQVMMKSEHVSQSPGCRQRRTPEQLQAIVHENAVRIARLSLSYTRIFGLENIITVMLDNMFVAAIAFISHILRLQQQGQPTEKDVHWLRLLSETLEAAGDHHPVTARMRSSLAQVVERTPLAHLFPRLPEKSPGSMAESVTGMGASTALPPDLAATSAAVPSADDGEMVNLDFTLTDEDGLWLHESGWNLVPWPINSTY